MAVKYQKGFIAAHRLEYASWQAARSRCRNPRHVAWRHYGGRGIRFCERWDNFELFVADLGRRPGTEYTLERKDNERGYEPDNCEWALFREQFYNKRNTLPLMERCSMRRGWWVWPREISPWAREPKPKTVEHAMLPPDTTWEDIADGWLPRHRSSPLY